MSRAPPDRGNFGSGPAGAAVAYLGAAWVVLQVVDSLDSLLGLPPPLVRAALALLLVGLPVVVVTAQVQSRTDTAVDEERGWASGLLGLFTWKNALLGGVAVFALWGRTWSGTRRRSGSTARARPSAGS